MAPFRFFKPLTCINQIILYIAFMKSLDQWLYEYSQDHKNPTNQKIHLLCVPLIMWSLLGILWITPKPSFMETFSLINWTTLFIIACLIFYALLDLRIALVMFFISLIMLTGVYFLAQTSQLLNVSALIFFVAWIGQFIGHKIEGKKPSFLQDLQFLLIGPLWVFKELGLIRN